MSLICEIVWKKNYRKKNRDPEPLDRPVYRFCSGSAPVRAFFPGSLVERFSVLTGPDAGPIPSLTGPIGRSGFDNLAYNITIKRNIYVYQF
jgi:hypothetical protein